MFRPRSLLLLVIAASSFLPTAAARAATLSFAPTGLEGGGFQNVVAADPANPSILLSGGDVSGIERSTDGGQTWRAANAGLVGRAQLEVAAFLFSPTDATHVYAAIGDAGAGGGLFESQDAGATWTLRSTVPQFAGGNAKTTGLPAEHPRSTGNLLAQAGRSLYAATFKQGVLRSDDGGDTWVPLGLSGVYLYAGTYGAGV